LNFLWINRAIAVADGTRWRIEVLPAGNGINSSPRRGDYSRMIMVARPKSAITGQLMCNAYQTAILRDLAIALCMVMLDTSALGLL
jgi:hypothetical protein